MRWGIIVLLLLGIVAAVSAAVLVGAVKLTSLGGGGGDATQTVEVLVATQDMPAMKIVTTDCVEKKIVPKADLPAGSRPFTYSETIGSALIVGVKKEQVLTESCFGWGGTGRELVARLAPGQLLYTVYPRKLPEYLFPGSVVDIGHVTRGSASVEPIFSSLLRGIQVLSVSGESIVTNNNPNKGSNVNRSSSAGGTVAVSLAVNGKQHGALELAQQSGEISLAVRNPLDTERGDMESMRLTGGQLRGFSPDDLRSEPNQPSQVDPNQDDQRGDSSTPAQSKQSSSSGTRTRKVQRDLGPKTDTIELETPREIDKGEDNK